MKGLWESVSGEWAGDVDLNDGKLRQMYEQYKEKIIWVKKIGLQSNDIEYKTRFSRYTVYRN